MVDLLVHTGAATASILVQYSVRKEITWQQFERDILSRK